MLNPTHPVSAPLTVETAMRRAYAHWRAGQAAQAEQLCLRILRVSPQQPGAVHLLGIMALLGKVFAPIMGLFGLPGEAITVLLTSWLSASAGTGVAVSLLAKGTLDGHMVTILAPAIFLMGSQLQYMGRLLGVADVPKKYWPLLMLTSIINAMIAMLIMRLFFA